MNEWTDPRVAIIITGGIGTDLQGLTDQQSENEDMRTRSIKARKTIRGHRHANFDLRFWSSSIRESSCCRTRSLAFLSSSSLCSRDCFSSTIDLRTLTTSRWASPSSFCKACTLVLKKSRSRASSVACMRALRTGMNDISHHEGA